MSTISNCDRLIILGAGGHGQVVADILLAMNGTGRGGTIVGFLDDDPALWQRQFLGIPVLGALCDLPAIDHELVVVAIGDNGRRMQIGQGLGTQGRRFLTAVHPAAVLGARVKIGAGTVICPGVVVNTAAQVGDGVILNTGAIVEHHCTIGDFSHVAPGARLGGEVIIGETCFIGMGATLLPGIEVGDGAIVGAGATVTQNVKEGSTVIGTPARPLMDAIWQ
jgi:acetyltransferase EpsM